jgi:hypothetical protein
VLDLRHAGSRPGGGDPPGFRLGDCRTQRNLSVEGRVQARRIGKSIRDSGLLVAGVLASPWCRSAETARSVIDRREGRTRQLIASHRGEEGVIILVGHYASIFDLIGETTSSGEAIAVRMDEGGDLDVLRRIPAS